MAYGYCGTIAHVDLARETVTMEHPSEDFYRRYMGGSAQNLHYLLSGMPAGADPLGPENILGLSVGVVTGVPVSGQSRVTASAKSPLTGAVGDSQAGGTWPAKLKWAGFDGVIIRGQAARPLYLYLADGKAELREAGHLWGRITGDVEAAIREEVGDPKAEVLQVGPAGERLVRFAALINMSCRANGRTGMGAVMGSKRLKAVVVSGSAKPAVADRDALKQLARWGAKALPDAPTAGLGKYGTAATIGAQHEVGGLPTRNFTQGVFEGWQPIDGITLYDTLLKGRETGDQDRQGRDTCFGCVVRCKRVVEKTDGPITLDPHYGGPEYETASTFGSYCGIDDLVAVCKANEICNQQGMDTISCGATIAWAMECFEAGLLTTEDTDGLELRFGNATAMLTLVDKIARREGFGDVLADGSAQAARRLNVGRDRLITSKGQEAPAHMPQLKSSLAVMYAVNPFGADHQSHEHDDVYEEGGYEAFADRLGYLGLTDPQPPRSLTPEKVRYICIGQNLYSFMDSVCICQFAWGSCWQLYGPEHMVTLVRAVTGWPVDIQELLTVGERRVNMMRVFNARQGVGLEQDRVPDKYFERPLEGGPSDGYHVDREAFEAAIQEYYRRRGWEAADGQPTADTLERLGLGWLTAT